MNRLRSLFNRILYIQLSPQRLVVRDPRSGQTFDEAPEIAIARAAKGKARIVGIGAQARQHAAEPDVVIVNPFAHPRSLVSDFIVAEQLLKQVVRRMAAGMLFAASPDIVIHPQGDPEGGFTQVELRALKELGMAAGGHAVRIWRGPALSDEDLLARRFPASGQLLTS
jgi:rod shape-determining protein MreB